MRVIIVELNPGRSIGLGPSLADHDVACARGIDAAIEILRTSEPEVIVLDVGTESGPHLVPSPAEAFQRLADAAAGARIIVAGAGDEILVQEMLSLGVFDFLTYPDELDSLAYAVKRATRVAQLEQENLPYTDAAKRAYLNERFESSRELFELVLERNPGDTEARCRLGNVLMRLDNLPEASETFRRAAELSTTNPYAHRMLGYTLLEMGDPVQAIESLKKSVELAPSNANGRVMLGRAYFEAGQEAEAEEELKSAIEFDDTMHEAHFNLAYLYAQQGKKKQGLEYYRNAVIRGAAPDMELEKSLVNRDR